MATRRKVPSSSSNPSAEIRGRFPAGHLGSPLEGQLPARAWARLFAIAVDRLHRAGKPAWAELTVRQFSDLELTWTSILRRLGEHERERRLEECFIEMERQQFGSGFKGTRAGGPTDRWLIFGRRMKAAGELSAKTDAETLQLIRDRAPKLSRRATRTALQAWVDVLDPPVRPGRPRRRAK